MRIAVTGATGFLGRYIVDHLLRSGHEVRAWFRHKASRRGMPEEVDWVKGELGDHGSVKRLLKGVDAVVHAGLHRDAPSFRDGPADLEQYLETNFLGSIQLFDAAARKDLQRFVFISSGAVHEVILGDRPLDENHPTAPVSHYGAHKAALEQFVHSFGWGRAFPICALRPTGIYGLAHPAAESKWFDLIQAIAAGQPVRCERGGKEVHAADVAKAVETLLTATPDKVTGQVFNCYDRYISEFEVAAVARELSGSASEIEGEAKSPKHQISTEKLRKLGVSFGGSAQLRKYVKTVLDEIKAAS